MTDSMRRGTLAAECEVFYRYLMNGAAGTLPLADDVVAAYVRAHQLGSVAADGVPPALERALLTVARTGPAGARLADAYAAVFVRPSLLRRKIVLLLAILESRGSTAEVLDCAVPGPRLSWVAELALRGSLAACRLALAALLVESLRVWYGLSERAAEDLTRRPAA